MKVYSVVQVFQGEGSILFQGIKKEKVFKDFQDHVKEYLDAGFDDYDGFNENSTEFHSDNMEVTFQEKDVPEIDEMIREEIEEESAVAYAYGAG